MAVGSSQSAPAGDRRAGGLALVAMVLACCSILPVVGVVSAPAAILLGAIALIRRQPRALAGGAIVVGLLTASFQGALFAQSWQARQATQEAACAGNLRAVGRSCLLYAHQHDGQFPSDLAASGMPAADLHCPLDHSGRPQSYFYCPGNKTISAEHALACDFEGNHSGGRCVLFADGHTQLMTEPQFQAAMDRPVNREFARKLRQAEGR